MLIDPAHGGTEIGSAISPTLPEKDVVLALGRKLQHELANRGISAGLLRNSDIAITLDQRAISANAARPAIYVALHAANSGTGGARFHRRCCLQKRLHLVISCLGKRHKPRTSISAER